MEEIEIRRGAFQRAIVKKELQHKKRPDTRRLSMNVLILLYVFALSYILHHQL